MGKQNAQDWAYKKPGQIIPKLALPTVVATTVQNLYPLADLLFAGRLGQTSIAGMGTAYSVVALVQAIGYTVALGGSTWVACLLGKGDEEGIPGISATTVWLGIILGTVCGGGGWILSPALLTLLGASGQSAAAGVAYLRPILLSAPFLCGGFGLTCLLRTVGRSTAAMVGILLGSGIKWMATPLLMYDASLGAAGAGIATLLGHGFTFLMLWMAYRKSRDVLSYSPGRISRRPAEYWQIIRYGISSLFRQGTVAVANGVMNRVGYGFSEGSVAALATAGRMAGVVYSALLGWGQGYQPVAGYYHGRGAKPSVRAGFRFALITGTAGMAVLGAVTWWLAPWGMTVLGKGDAQSVGWGVFCLRAQAVCFPFIPLGVLTNITYQALERPWMATLLACCRQGLCFLPLLWLLPSLWGVQGLLAVQGVADGLSALVSLPAIWFLLYKKGTNDKH